MNHEKIARKIVISKLNHFWWYVSFSFFLAVLIQVLAFIPPFLMSRIVDVYLVQKDTTKAFYSIFMCVLIPICSAGLSTFYNYKLNAVGRNMGAKLSLLACEKLVYQPLSYFADKNSSELTSYCNSESMKYIVFWLFDLPELAASLLSGIFVYLFILTLQPGIGFLLLFYFPILLLPSHYLAKKVQFYIKRVIKNNALTSQLMNDTLRGIELVKASGLEQQRLEQIRAVNEDTVAIWSRTVAYDNLNGMWTGNIVDRIFIGITFGMAVFLVMNGNCTLGVLLALLNYLPILFNSVRKVTSTNFRFQKQLAEYNKLFELITMTDEREMQGTFPFSMETAIRLEHVAFSYDPEKSVLRDVNLKIPKGSWIGIIGESGSGKSTLFSLILRFYKPDSGAIWIDEKEIQTINFNELRNQIALVSQNTFLFPGTVEDNLRAVCPKASREELLEVLSKVGLENLEESSLVLERNIGENGILLSGGQKQRLGLARGLLRNCSILLLDEVTANVDSKLEQDLKMVIKQLQLEKGFTVLSISHRLDFLDQADVIVELKNGKISSMLK